jgi:phenylacetate-CoA ligase
MTMRGYGWAGAHDAEKLFFLWSIPVDNPPLVKRLKVRLHDALLRRRFFNNFTLSKSTLPICLDALNRYAPRVLIGYTSMLEYLARHVQKHGGLKVRLHSVLAAAEALSQSQRELLHEAFRAPVFASYGSREFKLIAMECENQSLHLSADNLLVEVLHQGKPATAGQLGEVVITDLHNFATPFIRYEIGDIATPGPQSCPCGRGLPVIGAVHGRIPDTIQTPDGRLITGIFFPHLLKEFDWIVQFQVVQKELDRLSISLVVSDQPLAERELPRVQEAILEVLGSGVSLQFAFCSEIPRTATGKHRAVVSEIPVQI